MVGLDPKWPQRGERFRDLAHLAANFESLFAQHCVNLPEEGSRPTPEKALQSFLIRDAYTHGGRLQSLNEASRTTNSPVDLTFITDEIRLPYQSGKIVCDILALHRESTACRPVLIELKSDRQLTRLVEQVETYSALIDDHADLFASLYGAVLDEELTFNGKCEKWIVWPAAGSGGDPREEELAASGVRCVTYEVGEGGYGFRVGRSPMGA